MPRQPRADTLQRWKRLIDSLAEDADGIPGLQEYRAQLEEMYNRAVQLVAERAAHDAAKQAATRELNEILEDGRKTLTVMRLWLQEHHGNRSERLIEFDIRPFRSRPRKKKPAQG
jgi:hypothetical protein